MAQYPKLLPGTGMTLNNAGAPESTLVALVVLFIVAVVLVGPAFALLFTLQSRRLLGADEDEALPAVIPAGRTQPPVGQNPVIRAVVLVLVVLVAVFRRPQHR